MPFMNKAGTSGKKNKNTMAGGMPARRAKCLQKRSVILHFVQKYDESTFRKDCFIQTYKTVTGYYRFNYKENVWDKIK